MRLAKYKILLAVLDYFGLILSFCAAFVLTGRGQDINIAGQALDAVLEVLFIAVYSLALIFVFQSHDLYKINVVLSKSGQVVAIFVSFLYAIVGLAIMFFFLRASYTIDSRLIVGTFGVVGFLVITTYRSFFFRPFYLYLNKKDLLRRNILIVGANLEAKNFLIQLELENIYGLRVIGFADDMFKKGEEVFEGYRNLGPIRNIPTIVKEKRVREILVTVSNIEHPELLHILDVCKKSGARVKVTSSLFDIIHQKVSSEMYYDFPIARLSPHEPARALLLFKRVFDIAGSAIGLALFVVPIAVIAVIIKLTSQGRIFYRQVRIGKDGQEFMFYKFRSMVTGSDSDRSRERKVHEFIKNGNHARAGSSKIVDENKVTRIGRFIRKTSLDELPQLFNVLKGDMSLVGPRPCLPYEFKAYDEWHKRRLSVLPGCTGLWQVSSRSETGFNDMVLLDLYYIDNISPWFDLQLILKTIPVMFFGKGGK